MKIEFIINYKDVFNKFRESHFYCMTCINPCGIEQFVSLYVTMNVYVQITRFETDHVRGTVGSIV